MRDLQNYSNGGTQVLNFESTFILDTVKSLIFLLVFPFIDFDHQLQFIDFSPGQFQVIFARGFFQFHLNHF